jgi:hypothetical protein
MKALNHWLRKIHRWLVIPFIVIVVAMVITRETPVGDTVQRAQQMMMVAMIVTGSYLYLVPYLSKRQRARRRTKRVKEQALPNESRLGEAVIEGESA